MTPTAAVPVVSGTRRVRRPGAVAAGLVVSALSLAACGAGNQVGAMQTPAPLSGTVTYRPACPTTGVHACSDLVALVPGAWVQAFGKDGVHEVHADAHGHYQMYLIEGRWTLEASRSQGASPGPAVVTDLAPGRSKTVDLTVHS